MEKPQKEERFFVEDYKVKRYRFVADDPSAMRGTEIIVLDQFRKPVRMDVGKWAQGHLTDMDAWKELVETHRADADWLEENIVNKLG